MNRLQQWAVSQWNSYKYRFVPWIAFNFNEKTARILPAAAASETVSSEQLVGNLSDLLVHLVQYTSLRDSLDQFSLIHTQNQDQLKLAWGFTVVRFVHS